MYDDKNFFPTLEDIQTPLPAAELEKLLQQYQDELPEVSVQTMFNLAWGLIKCNAAAEQKKGLDLLVKIYSDSPSRRRECLFYLSLGSYKLGDYTAARRYCDALLRLEPGNAQTLYLKSEIEHQLNKEGMIGMAILGGSVAAVGAAATLLGVFLGRKKR